MQKVEDKPLLPHNAADSRGRKLYVGAAAILGTLVAVAVHAQPSHHAASLASTPALHSVRGASDIHGRSDGLGAADTLESKVRIIQRAPSLNHLVLTFSTSSLPHYSLPDFALWFVPFLSFSAPAHHSFYGG